MKILFIKVLVLPVLSFKWLYERQNKQERSVTRNKNKCKAKVETSRKAILRQAPKFLKIFKEY